MIRHPEFLLENGSLYFGWPMTDDGKKTPDHLAKLISWMKGPWVRDVPPEMALCEFDCRKDQCLEGEWATCERRITRAAGELMPGPPTKRDNPDR